MNARDDGLIPLGSSPRNAWGVSPERVSLVRPARAARPISLPARARTLSVDLARSAIIVVDMQNDFCHPMAGSRILASTSRRPARRSRRSTHCCQSCGNAMCPSYG